MYLRFTISERDTQSQTRKGLFTAAYELREGGKLSGSEVAQLQGLIDWFKKHLPVPTCFRRPESRRAICWFLSDAGQPLTRMWGLVNFLENKGVFVRLYKTDDPGVRLYRDEYQVVAVPQARQRVRQAR
jgi:hypothetical protein